MRFLRTFGRLLVVLVLAAIAAVLAWVQVVGFGPGIVSRVSEALSVGGLKVEIGLLRFNPFQGFIAEDSTVSVGNGAGAPFRAQIDRVMIAPNVTALLSGTFIADSLEIDGGRIEIPFADDGVQPDVIHIDLAEADIFQTANEVQVTKALLAVEGVQIDLRATLLNPMALQPSAPREKPDTAARAQAIRAVLAALEEIDFKEGRPVIEVEVRGDLADLDTLEAPVVKARVGAVVFREIVLNQITADAVYKGRQLDLRGVSMEGPNSRLRVTGDWDALRSAGELEITGTVHPANILASFGKHELSEDVEFLEGAEVSAVLKVKSSAEGMDIRAFGRLESGAFQIRDVEATRFAADFAWNNGRFYTTDSTLELKSGTISADVLSAPDDFRMRLRSTAVPTELLPIMGKYERADVELMEFEDEPQVEVTVSGVRPHLDALSGEGKATLGRTAMRGAWIDSAVADFEIKDRAVIYRNILLKMDGQQATGSFTYDFGRREVRLGNVRSNVMPAELLMWVDPRIAKTLRMYKFRSPPNVEADGLVHMENPEQNALMVKVDAPGGLDYSLIGKELPFGPTSGTVELKGQMVYANIPTSSLYGGKVQVKAQISTDPKKPTLSADLEMDRVDFASITKRYFGYENSKGVMTGRYRFTSMLNDDGAMRGEGDIRVEDGHVLAIPVFGPLSEIISAIIPGAGHESARLATADFKIADREITSSNLEIEGEGFSLFGDGDVRYPGGEMNMTVRINARGIPGIVLFPVSKLLEYVSTGTVGNPQWRPKIVPREFFEILGMGSGNAPPPRSESSIRPRGGGPKGR